MSTRYVWGRYNATWRRVITGGTGAQGSGEIDFNTTYYLCTTSSDNILDESQVENAAWAADKYEIITILGDETYESLPSGTYFDDWPSTTYPTGRHRFDNRADATVSIYTSTRDNDELWLTYRGQRSYLGTERSKGTAAGTVSNASAGAYQLDTSVDSLL